MTHNYAYALELERSSRNARPSSAMTTISTLAHYAALSPTPQTDTSKTKARDDGGDDDGDGWVVHSPTHPTVSNKFRGIKGSLRKRKSQYQKAQQRHNQKKQLGRQDQRIPPAKKTKRKKKGEAFPFSLAISAAAIAGGRRNNSAAAREEEDDGAPSFVQKHFPDPPRVPVSRHVPSEDECERLFVSASLPYDSSVSTEYPERAHGDHQGHNKNSLNRGDTEDAKREAYADDKDEARFPLLPRPPYVGWGTATGTNSMTMMKDEGERKRADWVASVAMAMAGVEFGEVNWGAWEQTRGRSHTTATPPPPFARDGQHITMRRNSESVDSPTIGTANTALYNYHQRHVHQSPRQKPRRHGKKVSTASSKPGSFLIGFEDPNRINTGLGITTRPNSSVASNFSYTITLADDEKDKTSNMADDQPYLDFDFPLLMPSVYQPESVPLLGIGTITPTLAQAPRPADDAKKTQDRSRLSSALAIRRPRNASSSSCNSFSSYYSDGIHDEDSDGGHARRGSIGDEPVPELTPDIGRTAHKPSSSSTDSYYPEWSTPATPPAPSLSPRPILKRPGRPPKKPLPLPPVLICPGCRIGAGAEEPVESDRSTPQDQHSGVLRWPEEVESGFCNACRLGGGLLPDYISRFTKAFNDGYEDGPPVPPEEMVQLMLLGGLWEDGEGKKTNKEDHEEPEEVVRKEIVVRPSLLKSKFHLGMTSESRIASRRQLGGEEAIARCESAPPPPTSSDEIPTKPEGDVAESSPLSDSEARYTPRLVQEGHAQGKNSGINGDGDREATGPQPQKANSSKPRRGGKGGGKRKRPPRLSDRVAERSLTRSNTRRWTDPPKNLADEIRSPLGEECWELDVLKDYEKTPVEAPSLPPLRFSTLPRLSCIERFPKLDWIEESPTKTPPATTPRTRTYNRFKRKNGDF